MIGRRVGRTSIGTIPWLDGGLPRRGKAAYRPRTARGKSIDLRVFTRLVARLIVATRPSLPTDALRVLWVCCRELAIPRNVLQPAASPSAVDDSFSQALPTGCAEANGGLMHITEGRPLDAAGRPRSPAAMPGYLAGRPPRNKGLRYPADPPRVEEIVAVMREAGPGVHGARARGLIVVLWRAGLRISEAPEPGGARPGPRSRGDPRPPWQGRQAT